MSNKRVSPFKITSSCSNESGERKLEYGRAFHITFPNGITLSTSFWMSEDAWKKYDSHTLEEQHPEMDYSDVEMEVKDATGSLIIDKVRADLFPDGKDPAYFTEDTDEIENWLRVFDWCRNRENNDSRHKTVNEIRRHVPNFISGEDRYTLEFSTVEELLNLPFVKTFLEDPGFFQWSIANRDTDGLLMAEYDGGYRWWVVGFIKNPNDVELPEWKAKYKREIANALQPQGETP